MINVTPTNEKLKSRAVSITSQILEIPEQEALALLSENGFVIRRAIESYKK